MIGGYVTRRVKRLWQKTFPAPLAKPNGPVRCREIEAADLEGIIDLLAKGFWQTQREHWVNVMRTITAHRSAPGYPKYGYMLEHDGKPVGVLLTIFTEIVINGVSRVWCCESSYYVEPSFRTMAVFMVSKAQRHKQVTFLNVTSNPKRWEILQKQGYKPIAQGIYASAAALCRPVTGARVRKVTDSYSDSHLDSHQLDLLKAHSHFRKCIALTCEHEGVVYPFVFGLRTWHGIPCAFLFYSKSQADFIKFGGTIGRFLLRRGILLVVFDADGPVAEMPGRFSTLYPKFWKGQEAPPLGNLAYTETAMFGVI